MVHFHVSFKVFVGCESEYLDVARLFACTADKWPIVAVDVLIPDGNVLEALMEVEAGYFWTFESLLAVVLCQISVIGC